ncbi:MAG TPA: hypothetical protein VMX94_01780 [Armatimonadota bacterium]|nr:hypothetical protein [Armatimonadota bacterium]
MGTEKRLGPSPASSAIHPRVIRFALPAEPCASSILRRFIRHLARGTNLSADEITSLQVLVTSAFNDAVTRRNSAGRGYVTLRILAHSDDIEVGIAYREFPLRPQEFFSRS